MRKDLRVLFISVGVIVTTVLRAGQPAVMPWGVELSYIDKSVKPGDSFFEYANGKWMNTVQISSAREYAGVNMEIDEQNEAKMKSIIVDLQKKQKLTGEERKMVDLYNAFTDQKFIEGNGIKPIENDLKYIKSLKTLEDIAYALGNPELKVFKYDWSTREKSFICGPFRLSIDIDDKNPAAYAVMIQQSGLLLPNRDYYLRSDKEIISTREEYKKYIEQILNLIGEPNVEERSSAIIKLETEIAKVSWPAEESRIVDKVYNPMTISELKKLLRNFHGILF